MQDPMTLMGMNMLANNKRDPFAAFGQAGITTEGQLQRIETASANRTWRAKQSEIQQERNRVMMQYNKDRLDAGDKAQDETGRHNKAMEEVGMARASKVDWEQEMFKQMVTGMGGGPSGPAAGAKTSGADVMNSFKQPAPAQVPPQSAQQPPIPRPGPPAMAGVMPRQAPGQPQTQPRGPGMTRPISGSMPFSKGQPNPMGQWGRDPAGAAANLLRNPGRGPLTPEQILYQERMRAMRGG